MEQLTVQQVIDLLTALPADAKQLPVFSSHGLAADYWPIMHTDQLVYDLRAVPCSLPEYEDGIAYIDGPETPGQTQILKGVVL